jgi:ComF family protein
MSRFRRVEPSLSCPLCGRWIGTSAICGACIESNPSFERGYYGFYFEGALREAVLAFKFKGRKDVGRLLVRLLEEDLKLISDQFDVVVPLPVTERRLKERGFNQCYVMGEEIGAITRKPLASSVLYKQKETKDQYTLSKDERKKNVKGAFALDETEVITDKRVLLIDDLMTTGYTVGEASRVLLSGKAHSVVAFALARTP